MFWREVVKSVPFCGFRLLKETLGKAIERLVAPSLEQIPLCFRKKNAVTRSRGLKHVRCRVSVLAPRREVLRFFGQHYEEIFA